MKTRIATWLLLGLIAVVPVQAAEAPTGTITGRVVDHSTGLGLRFANVVVLGTVFGAHSFEEGRFVIQGIPAGEHRIRVVFLGFEPTFENVTVTAGETTMVEIELAEVAPSKPTGKIVGRVSDRVTGSGMRFANVVVVDSLSVEKNERFLISGRWGATAWENGRFVIYDMPPGAHRLKASYVGYHPAYGNVTVAAGKTTTVRLVLQNTYPREPVRVPKEGMGRIHEDPKVRAYQNIRAILGIGHPIDIDSWGPSEAGRGGGTIHGARDSAFAYERCTVDRRERLCLYRGAVHPDREGARLVAIGSEEERALLDALLSWSDYQISPSRRDSLFTLTNDSTQAAEFRESLLLDLDDAQRRALALTGVLRELEEQRTRRLRK